MYDLPETECYEHDQMPCPECFIDIDTDIVQFCGICPECGTDLS